MLQLSLDQEEVLELLQQSLDLFAIEIGRRVAVGLLDDEVQCIADRGINGAKPIARPPATAGNPATFVSVDKRFRSSGRGFDRPLEPASYPWSDTLNCSSPTPCRRPSCGGWFAAFPPEIMKA